MLLSQATCAASGEAVHFSEASSRPVRIMVDVDGTLTSQDRVFDLLRRDFNLHLDRFSVPTYNVTSLAGLSSEEGQAWWEDNGRTLFVNERQFPGANRVLQRLAARGIEPYIVTARPHWAREITERWLRRRRIPYAGIVTGAVDKLRVCEELGLVAAIEDSPSNALQIAERLPVILIRWGYNEGLKHPRIFPVTHWSEVEATLIEKAGIHPPAASPIRHTSQQGAARSWNS